MFRIRYFIYAAYSICTTYLFIYFNKLIYVLSLLNIKTYEWYQKNDLKAHIAYVLSITHNNEFHVFY